MVLAPLFATLALAYPRERTVPTSLSPAHRNASVGPWGDVFTVRAKIATILAARGRTPRGHSVAEHLVAAQAVLHTVQQCRIC